MSRVSGNAFWQGFWRGITTPLLLDLWLVVGGFGLSISLERGDTVGGWLFAIAIALFLVTRRSGRPRP